MESYCDINNAYINKGLLADKRLNFQTEDLDKMARQVNNNKRSKTKDMYRKYRKTSHSVDPNEQTRAVAAFFADKTDKGTNILPCHQSTSLEMATVSSNGGFYSAQGDYTENMYRPTSTTGTLLSNINNTNYEDISLDTPSINTDSNSDNSSEDSGSDSLMSLDLDTREIDKQIKTKSKFNSKKRSKRHKCIDFDLNSVESLESLDSGESLLRHIRFCKECKDKVINLIRENGKGRSCHKSKFIKRLAPLYDESDLEAYTNTNHVESTPAISVTPTTSGLFSSMPELKEIIIVCLIGFLIIMILDLMMRSR